ncbi:GntR family transcriptional regulator [Nocardioides sp. cx-169]|nr:GntR family transcriptional regulator [Nocardioides sp. cx-169]
MGPDSQGPFAGRRPLRSQHRSLADTVASTLRDLILVGELEPGRRMTQDELAKMLDVSTMPVREALLKLSSQGLIEASPNRSFRVIRTTRKDVEDTYWQHAALAGELTRRACENRSGPFLKTLAELETAYETAVESGHPADITSANTEFHRVINKAAASPRLVFMLNVTLGFIPGALYSEIPEWGALSVNAHRMILSAMTAGYAKAADQAASEHVHEAGRLLIAVLEERGLFNNQNS